MLREILEYERHAEACKLRVYLAGPSRELDRVTKMALALEASGHVEITHRWWRDVIRDGVGRDGLLSTEEQQRRSLDDIAGIRRSHLLWVLWPDELSLGAPCEFMFAHAKKLPTVATGLNVSGCIFTSLATYRNPSDLLGLHEVLRRAGEHVAAHAALAFVT